MKRFLKAVWRYVETPTVYLVVLVVFASLLIVAVLVANRVAYTFDNAGDRAQQREVSK